MITISKSKGLSDAKLDALAEEYYHKLTATNQRAYYLQNKLFAFTRYKTLQKRNALDYINANLKSIIIGRPCQLELHKTEIENHLDGLTDEVKKSFKVEIKNVFDYEGFRGSQKAIWLAKSLNLKTCQYCGSQFLLLSKNSNGKIKLRFELDHFYPKSPYPYLSLSFFNLIPSCSSCNKNKTSADTLLSTHIHPHVGSSYDDISVFTLNKYDFASYLMVGKAAINITPIVRDGSTRTQKVKLDNHEAMFSLESIYSNHVDYAEELILKSVAYPQEYRKKLIEFLNKTDKSLLPNIDDLDRFILGNYTKTDEYNNRPLAKMTYDLAKELKIVS